MEIVKKLADKLYRRENLLIAIAGIVLLISLIFVYCFPGSIAILVACIACGLMNIVQAFRFLKDPGKKSMGMSMLMLGIIIIVVGFVILVIT